MKGFWRFIGSAAVALALIGLWQLGADAGLISPVFFPVPTAASARCGSNCTNPSSGTPSWRPCGAWRSASCRPR